MSTTEDLRIAVRYARDACAGGEALLLRLRTTSFLQLGADLAFLSCFPQEAEFLYPPLVLLRPRAKRTHHQLLTRSGVTYSIVEVEPHYPV